MVDRTTVAVVGGTGALGQLIGQALLDKPDVELRLLVRPGSGAKAEALRARGAQVVEGRLDAGGELALQRFCAGAAAVVSAVQGGPEEIIDGQLRLLRAARTAGVGRFLPSDYTFNIFAVPEGANINSDWRRDFATAADAERGDVTVVHVLNGCFTDRKVLFGFLGAIDLQRGEVNLWGEGDEPMDFTTYADTARYAAAAATDTRPVPSVFSVAGDVLNFHAMVRAYEDASGRSLTVRHHGTLDELDVHIAERRRSDPEDLNAYLPSMYWRSMLDGNAKLGGLLNDRYPDISPTTVAEYVSRERL